MYMRTQSLPKHLYLYHSAPYTISFPDHRKGFLAGLSYI